MSGTRVLERHTPMPFGKYKGRRIESIIMEDPFYIRWCIENANILLDNSAFELYEKQLEVRE